jgi:hypothetical protein
MSRSGVLSVIVVLVVLAGCAPAPADGPTTSPSTTAPTPGPEHPSSAFDVACDELVDPTRLDEVVSGSTPEPRPLYLQPDGPGLVNAALLQAGALACAWSGERPFDTGLLVFALPDARDGLAASIAAISAARPYDGGHVETDAGDGGLVRCQPRDEYRAPACDWTIAAGDAWLFVRTAGLADADVDSPPDTGGALPPTTPIAGSAAELLVEDIAAVIAAAPRLEVVPTAGGSLPECTSLIAAERLADALDVDPAEVVVYPQSDPATAFAQGSAHSGLGMPYWAASELGYQTCSGAIESSGSHSWGVTLAPDGGWLATSTAADFDWPDTTEPYVSCWADEGGAGCRYAILTGSDLRAVTVYGDDAEELTRKLGALLVP